MRGLALLLLALAVAVQAKPERNDPEIVVVNRKLDTPIRRFDEFNVLQNLMKRANIPIKPTFGRVRNRFTIITSSEEHLQELLDSTPLASVGALQVLALRYFFPAIVDARPLLEMNKNSEFSVASPLSQLLEDGEEDTRFGTSKFGLFINGVRVTKIVVARNGIIYVIDGDLGTDFGPLLRLKRTIGSALSEMAPEGLFYPRSSNFAGYYTAADGEGTNVAGLLRRKNRRTRLLVLMPSNRDTLNYRVNRAEKRGVNFLYTKIVGEHTFKLDSYVTRELLLQTARELGSFSLTNLNGREVEFTTNHRGELTIGGFTVYDDVSEIVCTNGLLLPIKGMLWHPYGSDKNSEVTEMPEEEE